MKRIFGILLLFLAIFTAPIIPSIIYGAPAYVQGYYGEDAGTSVTVSFPSPVTAGNMIVAVIRVSDISSPATCTSGGRTFHLDDHHDFATVSLDVHSLPNAAGGNTSVTCTSASSDALRLTVLEFSGVASSSQTVDTATKEGDGGFPNAGPVTTITANSLLLFAAGSDSDEYHTKPNPGSGWTVIDIWAVIPGDTSDPDKTAEQWRVAATPGNYSSTFSSVNVASWAAILVAYKPAGGGDVTPPAPPGNLNIFSR